MIYDTIFYLIIVYSSMGSSCHFCRHSSQHLQTDYKEIDNMIGMYDPEEFYGREVREVVGRIGRMRYLY